MMLKKAVHTDRSVVKPKFPWQILVLVGLVFSLVLVMNFSRVVRKDYSHDEDQFITSAWFMAQDGLLPYRDYAYFHAPYLVFIYAALFRISSESPLLIARLFSALCGSVGIFIVFFLVKDFFLTSAGKGKSVDVRLIWFGYLAAAGIAVLYLLNPLTAAATGLSWNHDVMTLFMLLGFYFVCRAQGLEKPGWWLFASGFVLALAVGVRVSAVTVLPAYLLAGWFFSIQRSVKAYGRWILAWMGGLVIGFLPMLVLFLLAPQQFVFGNLAYAALNTRYRQDAPVLFDGNVPVYGPSSLAEKMGYLQDTIIGQPAVLLVFLLLAFLGWTGIIASTFRRKDLQFRSLLLLLLVPFAGIGSFLPSPSWIQYFFIPLPFALLAIAFGMALLSSSGGIQPRWILALLVWVIFFTTLYQFQDFRRLGFLRYPDVWRPQQIHLIGQQIHELVGDQGKVFTLSPLFLLEGGLPIDSYFVTGTFAYRTGALLSPQERRQYGIVAQDDLVAYLDADPPDGIFLGLDPILDPFIQEYAENRGYRQYSLTKRLSLWVR